MLTAFVFALGLLLLAFWIFKPLRDDSELVLEHSKALESLKSYEGLIFDRERILENLVEADADLKFEKISRADYENLRARLLAEAAKVYAQIEAIEKESPFLTQIEEDLQTLRKGALKS